MRRQITEYAVLLLALLPVGCATNETKQKPALKVERFDPQPEAVHAGEGVLLSWEVPGATTVEIESVSKTLSASGEWRVFPMTTRDYLLTASDNEGHVVKQAAHVSILAPSSKTQPFPETLVETDRPAEASGSRGTVPSKPGGSGVSSAKPGPSRGAVTGPSDSLLPAPVEPRPAIPSTEVRFEALHNNVTEGAKIPTLVEILGPDAIRVSVAYSNMPSSGGGDVLVQWRSNGHDMGRFAQKIPAGTGNLYFQLPGAEMLGTGRHYGIEATVNGEAKKVEFDIVPQP